ncbi:hypothetical protein [Effusibacillus dendaii]|uniref:Uncharacterized protein n=1 Tax=Effusibacillus dendaii TaxID=2743772 RepID=A0A7I8D7Y5_9BACL|nr:hypothetical protein [Effusibacillus dendaii]BCJ86224.1 hypothetical protein skT53_12090 [Effusibacillus dendaii]
MIGLIILAAVFVLANIAKNGFPRLPDGRDNTPLGPGGHRKWSPMSQGENRNRLPEPDRTPAQTRPVQREVDPVPQQSHVVQMRQPKQEPQQEPKPKQMEQGGPRNLSHPLLKRDDLLRAVVLSEILSPPRARNRWSTARKTNR